MEYAAGFRDLGYQVSMVANKHGQLWKKAENIGLTLFPFSVKNLSFLNPFSVFQMVRFFKSEHIDTVIFSASQDMKLVGIAAKIAGVEKIVYLRCLAKPMKNNLINRILFKRILTHIVSNSEETKRTIVLNMSGLLPAKKVRTIYHGIYINSNELRRI